MYSGRLSTPPSGTLMADRDRQARLQCQHENVSFGVGFKAVLSFLWYGGPANFFEGFSFHFNGVSPRVRGSDVASTHVFF